MTLLTKTPSILVVIFLLFTFFTKTTLAGDDYTGVIQNCKVEPALGTSTQDMTLTIQTELIKLPEMKLDVENNESHNPPTGYNPDWSGDSSEKNSRDISLGTFPPGSYKLHVYPEDFVANFGVGECTLEAAFAINTTAGIELELPDPTQSLPPTIQAIEKLIIAGLTAGQTYSFKLPNWEGGDLADNLNGDSLEWTADGTGKVTAEQVCNNGEARGAGTSDPCGQTFGGQTYTIIVKDNSGTSVAFLAFRVASTGVGQNPCKMDITTGQRVCQTSIGNITADPSQFVGRILTIALGLAGGIALIFMVIGSIKVLTSSGDQQKLNAGKDQIVAAVAGLLFLIFSVLILRFFGLVMQIPFI